jgi:hypothetical protein
LISGLVNTTAQVGGAFGLAILATLAESRTHDLLATGVGEAAALAAGYHLAFGIGAVCLVLALIVSAIVLQTPSASGDASEAAQTQAA